MRLSVLACYLDDMSYYNTITTLQYSQCGYIYISDKGTTHTQYHDPSKCES